MGASGQVPPRMSCTADSSEPRSAMAGGIGESHVLETGGIRPSVFFSVRAEHVSWILDKEILCDSQFGLDVGRNDR